MSNDDEIRPFRLDTPEDVIVDLRSRIASYYKIFRAFVGGEPAGGLTRDAIVDNITL
ncbi:hypothetical protein [Micromonospora ureilytica]|uniref:hypothetical protein n=1 Tax=Micromonospora ureilytica TaxID=709868 RepID=UPI002E0E4E19|nr:hypothetical protein OHB55_00685 [Micromonospora ureilytica]